MSYEASTASQSAIFECATVSRLGLRDVAGRTVVRFLCAAYLAAFAGLRDSHYDVEQVLLPFVQRHGLLTDREWALLSRRGGFAATGDRYRELLAWAVGVAQRERNDGRCHPEDARRIVKPCVEIKLSRRVSATAESRRPRHRRDACSMAWRCRFLAARRSQDGRVIAEK